jgi:CHASE2 domain-containing sensor protein
MLQYDEGALDTAFDWRFKAPSADERFLIVEIDEASLAYFADIHGRWPWPRYIFAEMLAGVSSYAPKSITFNIMFSDPDKQDPGSDAIFNSIIEEVDNVIFPATRLSEINDSLSQVLVSRLPFANLINEDQTVAILLTLFRGAEEKMGINNLKIDDDGIVRRYSSLYRETNFSLKTIPSRIGETESKPLTASEYLINWPESIQEYGSISFKDLYIALEEGDELLLKTLSGKHMIIGLTAPGLSFQRPTPISSLTEDNRILASIADNIINDNGLKTAQPITVLFLSIFLFGILSLCHVYKVSGDLIDTAFFGVEASSILITIGSISYTNYAIDLSYLIFVGLLYFGICRTYDIPVKSSERAHRRFFNDKLWQKYQYFSVIIIQADNSELLTQALGLKSKADERIFLVDNFLSSNSLFQEEIVDTEVMIYLHNEPVLGPNDSFILSAQFNSLVTEGIQANTLRVIIDLYQKALGRIADDSSR